MDELLDIMVDPERTDSLEARRTAWNDGFDFAAREVEAGRRTMTSYSETVRSGIERGLQRRRDDAAGDAFMKFFLG